MPNFIAEQAMHLKRQEIGFSIDNHISKTYIFLHFINPITITLNGVNIQTSSNACIIFSPGSYLNYSAERIIMFHNFLHFNIINKELFDRLKLPLNTIFYTNLQNEITNTVEQIEVATVKKFENYIQIIDKHITKIFGLLSEEMRHRVNFEGFSSKARFDDLRSLIYQAPKDWSVEKMARFMNLSRSRFSTKYRERFSVTPNEDLTYAALLYANRLLATTDIKISDLTYECGFTSPDYFIRLYKKHYNITPGAYRKRLKDDVKQPLIL